MLSAAFNQQTFIGVVLAGLTVWAVSKLLEVAWQRGHPHLLRSERTPMLAMWMFVFGGAIVGGLLYAAIYYGPWRQSATGTVPSKPDTSTETGASATGTRVGTLDQVNAALTPVRESQYRGLVADVIHAMEPQAYIAVGGEIVGPDGARTVDVQVWSIDDRSAGPAIIDVIDQPDGLPVGISAVDHADSKRRDLPVRAALISSNTRFTREAISKAKRVGIGLITVLKQGDQRASVIEEEVYLRTVTISNLKFSYTNKSKPRIVGPYDVMYRGVSIGAWLQSRVLISLAGVASSTNGLMLYYRLKQPTDFNAPGGKLRNVSQIAAIFDVSVEWASQIAQFNAKNAIYDYVRRRARLFGENNSYTVANVNWETATPIDAPPEIAPLARGEALKPGEVDLMLMRVKGFPKMLPEDPKRQKTIDELISPDDLKAELQPVGMRQATP